MHPLPVLIWFHVLPTRRRVRGVCLDQAWLHPLADQQRGRVPGLQGSALTLGLIIGPSAGGLLGVPHQRADRYRGIAAELAMSAVGHDENRQHGSLAIGGKIPGTIHRGLLADRSLELPEQIVFVPPRG